MPVIRPVSDLKNRFNEIREFCHIHKEPVFITKNGVGDMVVLSIEMFECQQAQLELYGKLAQADAEIAAGDEGMDFFEAAKRIRDDVFGKV
ncbi:MAG: type II toxin-antitoxin system Phd/YefM family antitoxin [Oscillospiraceae bacterium]|nr:type II toxin-antitoxin system Phd/YefM family antitoxin [Oscillospiraceae bacterium]